MTGGGGGGAGGGAGATDAASTKPSLAQYVLSTQLVDGDGARAHDGAVGACTVDRDTHQSTSLSLQSLTHLYLYRSRVCAQRQLAIS